MDKTCCAGELDAHDAQLYFEVLAPYFWRVRVAYGRAICVGSLPVACFHTGQLFDDVPTINACLVVQKHDLAEALLYVCRRLWGQPHVAPIYAMLLYQWLLLHRDAGGAEQRLKHLKVMVSGAPAL